MKKIIQLFVLLGIALIVFPSAGNAQLDRKFEITPTMGYFFGGNIKFYEGKLKIRDNVSYGVIGGVPLSRGSMLEISYTGMNSKAEWRPRYGYDHSFPSDDFNVMVNYLTVGGVQEAELANNVFGFGALRVGAAWFNASSGINDVWRFAISLGGGAKVFLTDRIGLRIHGNLHIPLYFSGVGMFCGIGSGGSSCGASLNSTSSILQGEIAAGLIFRLGGNSGE